MRNETMTVFRTLRCFTAVYDSDTGVQMWADSDSVCSDRFISSNAENRKYHTRRPIRSIKGYETENDISFNNNTLNLHFEA